MPDEFVKYKELILHELQQMRVEVKSLSKSMQEMAIDLTKQKLQIGIISGAIGSAFSFLWQYFTGK